MSEQQALRVNGSFDLNKQEWSKSELMLMGHWLARDIFIGGPNHPIDEFDFQGCLKLIDENQHWRRVFSMMSDLSPEWKALNWRWNDIEATFLNEIKPDGSPLLYGPLTRQLMSHVLKQARLTESIHSKTEMVAAVTNGGQSVEIKTRNWLGKYVKNSTQHIKSQNESS